MGRLKDLLIERQEESEEQQLAHKLGITHDELIILGHKVDTDESEDGIIYNYVISFRDDAPKKLLTKVHGIDRNSKVWLSPAQYEGDYYYEEQYRAIVSNKHFYESFLQAMAVAKQLNNVVLEQTGLMDVLKRQIYVSIMAALESFLSETFVNLTNDNDHYFRRFVESFPDFSERKIPISRIFIEQELIKDTAKRAMVEVIYHNLAKVSKMYTSTFDIEFPKISLLAKCVSIRHDLVHRNGKTTKGDEVHINSQIIDELIAISSDFVKEIAEKLKLSGRA